MHIYTVTNTMTQKVVNCFSGKQALLTWLEKARDAKAPMGVLRVTRVRDGRGDPQDITAETMLR